MLRPQNGFSLVTFFVMFGQAVPGSSLVCAAFVVQYDLTTRRYAKRESLICFGVFFTYSFLSYVRIAGQQTSSGEKKTSSNQ